MPVKSGKLKLFEALELRAEYDARVKTLSECLPEKRETRGRYLIREEDIVTRPAPGFDPDKSRKEIAALEQKRRTLNAAVQAANFHNTIELEGGAVTLAEALDLRKSLNTRIGEMHTQVTSAAWQRVIYKEGRDIVQESHLDYARCLEDLDRARREFRDLNRKLRTASFLLEVDFRDEE